MPADAPTIVATSGGLRRGLRGGVKASPMLLHVIDLAGAECTPTLLHVGTAMGDLVEDAEVMDAVGRAAGLDVRHLALFPMPSVDDMQALVLDADVVWVGGGSVANLLALWRLHGLDVVLREAWQAGVVLAGSSAGSICWFRGGTTDSFGPTLRPVTDGLALLPFDNGVHMDAEPGRRPLVHALVADGTLGETHCTDDGAGLVYRGTTLVEAIADVPGAAASIVVREGDGVVERRLEPRLLA